MADSPSPPFIPLSIKESLTCDHFYSFLPSMAEFAFTDDPKPIQDKIRCAFQNLHGFGGIIQFWAPVKTCGRKLLTTAHQPFALENLDKSLDKYRLSCLKYQYGIDSSKKKFREDSNPTIISHGAPATAFANQRPAILEIAHQGRSPLVSSALECGLMHSILLPVFYPSVGCCVGVVECAASSSHQLLQLFNDLNTTLEEQGLKTFDARERLPYKTIGVLKHAKDEIDEALKIIWHTHGLVFTHVGIAYEDENRVSFSSFLEVRQPKQTLGLKLTGPCLPLGEEELEWYRRTYKNYSDASYRFPLKMGEGLIGKTLESYEPYFIKDISKLSGDELELMRLLSISVDCSCFVIYLRSTKTGDLDYVFEFLWSQSRDNIILIESLLITLKRCLSSFKFASGAEFGDELCIVDVKNSIGSEMNYFKIFRKNKSSYVAQALKRGRQPNVEESLTPLKAKGKTTPIKLSREQIKSQFGQTQEEAAPKLGVSVSTLKRKCGKLGIKWEGKDKNPSGTDEEEDIACQDPWPKTVGTFLFEPLWT